MSTAKRPTASSAASAKRSARSIFRSATFSGKRRNDLNNGSAKKGIPDVRKTGRPFFHNPERSAEYSRFCRNSVTSARYNAGIKYEGERHGTNRKTRKPKPPIYRPARFGAASDPLRGACRAVRDPSAIPLPCLRHPCARRTCRLETELDVLDRPGGAGDRHRVSLDVSAIRLPHRLRDPVCDLRDAFDLPVL